jgi:hypothetical protein
MQIPWLMATCIGIASALFIPSSATQANLFGPRSYDSCINQGKSSVKSDAGLASLRSECARQFLDDEKVRARCKTRPENDHLGKLICSGTYHPRVASEIDKVRVINFDSRAAKIQVQNNADLSIAAISIGFIGASTKKSQTCSRDPNDYRAVAVCAGFVGKGLLGTLDCQPEIRQFPGLSYCVVGIAPALGTGQTLSRVMNSAGWCEP